MSTPQTYGLTQAAYSVAETMTVLSLGRTSVYGLVKTGKLRATKCGKKTLFLAIDIATFLSRLQNGEMRS